MKVVVNNEAEPVMEEIDRIIQMIGSLPEVRFTRKAVNRLNQAKYYLQEWQNGD
jgi:hypothetical protein